MLSGSFKRTDLIFLDMILLFRLKVIGNFELSIYIQLQTDCRDNLISSLGSSPRKSIISNVWLNRYNKYHS